MQNFRALDDPQAAFGGRSMKAVFASASAGCGPDQHALAEFALEAGLAGRMSPTSALVLAEMWALQAINQGVGDARMVLANSLLLQAQACLDERWAAGLDLLAEAISWLDELAADDHIAAARSMDMLLTDFLAVGGTEQERAAVVALAKDMREWRRERGSPNV